MLRLLATSRECCTCLLRAGGTGPPPQPGAWSLQGHPAAVVTPAAQHCVLRAEATGKSSLTPFVLPNTVCFVQRSMMSVHTCHSKTARFVQKLLPAVLVTGHTSQWSTVCPLNRLPLHSVCGGCLFVRCTGATPVSPDAATELLHLFLPSSYKEVSHALYC